MGPDRSTKPAAVVHIGTAKTGTTTLQTALHASSQQLAEHGVAYLASPGMINARELAAASVGPTGFDDHLDSVGAVSADQRRRFRDEVEVHFARQVARAAAAGAARVVVSSEHLHSRLVTTQMVADFAALVAPHVSATQIVCYLRPQVDLVASFHSTHIRNGGTNSFDDTVRQMLRVDSTYTNYDLLLSMWADVFGEESLTVRIFDRDAFEGGSIVADAEAALGLPHATLERTDENANRSISSVGQAEIERVNARAADGAITGERAAELRASIADSFPGRGQTLSAERAAVAQRRFAESNERVRKRFRPDLDRLFPPAPAPERTGSTAGRRLVRAVRSIRRGGA